VVVRIEKVDADGKPTGELIDPNAQTSISFWSIGAKGKVRASFTGITENTEGLACAVVCYIPIINSSNYYIRYADATQYSDGMAGGTNDGTTWTNNQAMLGCWSDWFAQWMMCRATTTKVGDKVKIWRMLYPSELTSVWLASNYFTLWYFKTSFPNWIYGIDWENIVSTNIKFFVFSVNAGFTKFIKNNIKYTEVSKSCTTGQTASYAFIAITDWKIKVNYHISASSYNMYYSRTYFNILQGWVNIYSDMVNPPTYGNTQTKDFSTEIDTFAWVEYKISVNNAVDSSASSGDGNFTAIIT
jgi:hypothetical protein